MFELGKSTQGIRWQCLLSCGSYCFYKLGLLLKITNIPIFKLTAAVCILLICTCIIIIVFHGRMGNKILQLWRTSCLSCIKLFTRPYVGRLLLVRHGIWRLFMVWPQFFPLRFYWDKRMFISVKYWAIYILPIYTSIGLLTPLQPTSLQLNLQLSFPGPGGGGIFWRQIWMQESPYHKSHI